MTRDSLVEKIDGAPSKQDLYFRVETETVRITKRTEIKKITEDMTVSVKRHK
jgi:hypothetical protein